MKKQAIIQNIKNNFQQAKATIFYNFHQARNEEIFCLKKELKKYGAFWKVYKNTLVKKALLNYPLDLKLANAFIFCVEDEYKPLSILDQFNQDNNDIRRFQGGIYEQKIVERVLLEKWAKLPSKEVLMNNLCYYLTFQVRKLTEVLEKIVKLKSN